jgi:drug/metabolite transporter (DMT)-like permease
VREAERAAAVSGAVLVQYVALAVTWGASFLFIKVALEGLSPGQVVLGRLTTGALALAVICAVKRQRLPRDPAVWGHLAVVAVLLCVFPFLMFAWAEQHVSSSVASILNAATPLMTMGVALAALPQERPTRTRLAGLLIGFVGVVVVLAPWRTVDTIETVETAETVGDTLVSSGAGGPLLWGQLACLAATFSYGIAFVYLRRFVSPRGQPAVPVATVQVGLGALMMLALSPLLATQPPHLSWRVAVAISALGVLGTGLAYVWNTRIVADWGATSASTVTYLTPLVGVIAGTAALGERVSWNQPVGAVVVIAGIAVSQDRLSGLLPRIGIA